MPSSQPWGSPGQPFEKIFKWGIMKKQPDMPED